MLTLTVGLVGLVLWVSAVVTRLNRAEARLADIERIAREARTRSEALAGLSTRIAALESRPAPIAAAKPASEASRVPVPARVAAADDLPVVPPVPHRTPAAPPPAISRPSAPAAVDAVPTRADLVDQAAASATDAEVAWEVTVGGNWLNKVGILIFVIGIALLVGYSMTHVGPAGRVMIGFAVSFGLLMGGVVMERRADYRIYAHGLIAGGWAGIYFTTYAMHAVDAARVLDSDLIAMLALSVVAVGMIWHSLRYRSQEVTALAFVVAFATLAISPLRAFSLTASVPLAVSVLVVAHRFSWPRVQILGVVCTYALYAMRGQLFGFGDVDLETFTPYAALAVYWVVFEVADLTAAARRSASEAAPPPLFLLNAAGLVGSALLQLPSDSAVPLSTFLLVSGAAYLGSAILRARLMPAGPHSVENAARGSYQGATALAAAFIAWAIELRFSGSALVIALLMEAELLVISAVILRDGLVRGLGAAVVLLTGFHAGLLVGAAAPGELAWVWSAQGTAGVAVLTAVVCYANREWLRARQWPLLLHEGAYTSVAMWLVILVARAELSPLYAGFAIFVFAAIHVEAGRRLGREYRYPGYVVAAMSAAATLAWFVSHGQTVGNAPEGDAWVVLGTSALVAYLTAWRASTPPSPEVPHAVSQRERVIGAVAFGALGTACVVVLEWVVVAPAWVAVAWVLTAAVIGGAGLWLRLSGLRLQAYPLLLLSLLRAMGPILATNAASSTEIGSALIVLGGLYGWSIATRVALPHLPKTWAELEDAVRLAVSGAATLALTALVLIQVRPTLVTVTWGLQAAGLLGIGFLARERLLRLSGLCVLLACIARLFVFDLPQLEELARIVSFVALGAVLLVVSWIYTRYRSQIQKFL